MHSMMSGQMSMRLSKPWYRGDWDGGGESAVASGVDGLSGSFLRTGDDGVSGVCGPKFGGGGAFGLVPTDVGSMMMFCNTAKW